jgi:hypothetical protein
MVAGFRVTMALADFVESAVKVAVTVTDEGSPEATCGAV